MICTKCRQDKTPSDFTPSQVKANGRHSWCRACVADAQRRRRLEGRVSPEMRRAQNLKSRYGISAGDFERMKSGQGDVCAICREPFSRQPHVDHDHSTGAVRGILCHRCNVRLPFVEDAAFRAAALAYLERAK